MIHTLRQRRGPRTRSQGPCPSAALPDDNEEQDESLPVSQARSDEALLKSVTAEAGGKEAAGVTQEAEEPELRWVLVKEHDAEDTKGQEGKQVERQGSEWLFRWKVKGKVAAIGFGILLVWYLTPVSDWIGDLWLMRVPIAEDLKLGQEVAETLPFRDTFSGEWTPLVHQVGLDLLKAHNVTSEYDWNFRVVRGDVVNAFALPNGSIRVTVTLLELLRPSRGELAAVSAVFVCSVTFVSRLTERLVSVLSVHSF